MSKEKLDKLYLQAVELSDNGDFEASFPLFLQVALQGHDGAQNAIGLAYGRGEGVAKDEKKGLEWLKKAHKTDGHTNWCGNIALTYAEMGNRRQALHWWRKGVAGGHGEDAFEMAKYLMISDEALELLKMAAACEAPLHISPLAKEEAEDMLAILTRANWDDDVE